MNSMSEIPLVSALSRAVKNAYREGKDDEMLPPFVLVDNEGNPVGRFTPGDSVIFYNIRGERERELTLSLTDPEFDKFPTKKHLNLLFATMIEYHKDLNALIAFPPEETIEETLSDVISRHSRKQIKITESEKAIHVTFFLKGKKDDLLPNEEVLIIPTRKDIALFDEAPEMSIDEVTKAVIEKIRDASYDFIFANFPNVDVVGHIENEKAIIRAVEAVDRATGKVISEALTRGMIVLVTSDHGTVEKWYYPNGTIDTGHTESPVPFILVCDPPGGVSLREDGELSDVAPTILDIMGLPKPERMTGSTLLKRFPQWLRKEKKRILLLILDGWGEQDTIHGNLIALAQTPTMDRLRKTFPFTTLKASGEAVGLPPGTVGNSEAGHLHIGSGRRIYSDRVKIDHAIADGSFFQNNVLLHVMRSAKVRGKSLHLLGIVSFFSSHGSLDHLFALLDMAKREGVHNTYIHAMLGRRGEMPQSGAKYLEKIEEKCKQINTGKLVSVIGRYWALDREENWERVERTYRMLVYGEGIPVTERR